MLTTEICAHFCSRILLSGWIQKSYYRRAVGKNFFAQRRKGVKKAFRIAVALCAFARELLLGHLGEAVAECVDNELESIGYLELGED